MTLAEAIEKSVTEHPEEWEVYESTESLAYEGNTFRHKPSGIRTAMRECNYGLITTHVWSDSAKHWLYLSDTTNLDVVFVKLWHKKVKEDIDYKLKDRLEGTKIKFTDDAEALAKAVLDKRTDAVWALVDELLEQRRSS